MVKTKQLFPVKAILTTSLSSIKNFFSPVILAAILCVFAVYSGIIHFSNRQPFNCLLSIDKITTLNGVVAGNPVKVKDGKYVFPFLVEKAEIFVKEIKKAEANANGKINVYISSEVAEALYPGKLFSSAKTRKAPLLEEGVKLNITGSFQSSNIGNSKNSISQIAFYAEKAKETGWGTLFPKAAKLRALCRINLKRLLYAWGEAGGLLLALLTGSREYTAKDIADAFTNSGLAHILALSGMHLSLFSGIALTTGSFFFGKKIGHVLSILTMLLFVWFAGITPSLFRALICSLCLSIAALCSIKTSMIEILAFSFIFHAYIRPEDLFTISFQLSYGALAGILLFSKPFANNIFKFLPPMLSNGLGSSTGAQTCTAFLCVKNFGILTPAGIAASVVVSPIASFFVTAGIIGIVISLIFPCLLQPVGFIINLLYYCLKLPVLFFAKCPHLEVL